MRFLKVMKRLAPYTLSFVIPFLLCIQLFTVTQTKKSNAPDPFKRVSIEEIFGRWTMNLQGIQTPITIELSAN